MADQQVSGTLLASGRESKAASPASASSGLGRLTGLDGLRGIAVLAVMLYHAGVSWLPGGLLGVDVFFVISGFLITYLLVTEWDRSGGIKLGTFWLRRARRLLPALVLMLLFVSVVWGLMIGDDSLPLRKDVLFALGYGANWWFAFSGQGYFSSFASPSPVLHTWSLSVEEQFYLLWPLVVVLLLRRGRSVLRWAVAGVALAAVATLIQSLAGVWTDRLYYGTDTRAIPLLVGAALACWFAGKDARPALTATGARRLQIAGLVGIVCLAWALASISGSSTELYRGGFLVLALLVGVCVLSLAWLPNGLLARLLSVPGLPQIGVISYGLYLWHWPLFLLIDHQRAQASGFGLLALRFAATLTVALLSYHFVERPIRQGRLRLPNPRALLPAIAVALIGVMVAVTAPAAATGSSSSVPDLTKTPTSPTPSNASSTVPSQAPSAIASASGGPVAANRDTGGTKRVLIVGDSLAYAIGQVMSFSQGAYHLQIDNEGLWGCGIARGGDRRIFGQVTVPPSFCATWPQRRAAEVQADKPDVAVMLVGLWEIVDQVHNGRWEHIGQPDFDSYLSAELDNAIETLSASGARVALLTMPCLRLRESADGSPYPEADPARVQEFNALLAKAQQRHADRSQIVDLKSMVCPNGAYTGQLDGVTLRTADGIHFPDAPDAPLAAALLPRLREVAVQASHTG